MFLPRVLQIRREGSGVPKQHVLGSRGAPKSSDVPTVFRFTLQVTKECPPKRSSHTPAEPVNLAVLPRCIDVHASAEEPAPSNAAPVPVTLRASEATGKAKTKHSRKLLMESWCSVAWSFLLQWLRLRGCVYFRRRKLRVGSLPSCQTLFELTRKRPRENQPARMIARHVSAIYR